MASLWRRILPQRVANSGSQLRDHQANERTFLSWTRMGLGFAAMALALGRLDAIDRIISSGLSSSKSNLLVVPDNAGAGRGAAGAAATASRSGNNSAEQQSNQISTYLGSGFSAATLCQGISVWSFGYGIFRYLSVRRNLLKGQFTPAIWGPAFITCGCLGVFSSMGLWMERRDKKIH
ncbi:hypothetical protein CNMCM8980_010077 [Aspergillus fumigatiaffinis]|jgi:hypothetical protein|uniref:DUF202 domain-containing protein n=1 Tax=Aspergillus fumigatiaffinis TaxID=340414 RepID=A0A8H4EB02_9EURO|nr:hypothetical protein CNMCM5878_000707 [Aspergillus fumigatiaffinis]KAF4217978.1 hypothetical protein CNMCM6457_004131 [Aspergillus fumigatiaffinis]KAF4242917.1 hypothetical protein CNMCM6805_002025 [Aspergillus fumigatiaffinis]KAF4250755.1 hypothetical protein CNMCM8980_010077 [Aspergillus fumigatiaffinis]